MHRSMLNETLSAEELVAEVVRQAAQIGGASVCLTSSFQTEDMVVLHHAA